MSTLVLADGSRRPAPDGETVAQVIQSAVPGLGAEAVAARVNGKVADLSSVAPAGAEIAPITRESPESLEVLRHSVSHVMAAAVARLFPGVKLAIGPAIENGFYYDFGLEHKFTPEDLPRIEAEMKRVVAENAPFKRFDLPRAEAHWRMESAGQPYKTELIEGFEEARVSFYSSGSFTDVCAGPHLPNTGVCGHAFKLLHVAGAYWRGDERNAMLQRIYGTAFWTQQALDDYLKQLDEARKRDHRVLGKQLQLFHISDVVGPGLVLWMPKGAVIRGELENWISTELRRRGYQNVYTPHIGRLGMFRTSGHYPYYQEAQYPPIVERETLELLSKEDCSCATLCNRMEKGELDGYLLKPMNCPHHIQIYQAAPHSYRDLPMRLAEFGTVYRFEQSGELNGMLRARGFTQDDAHLFCTPDQLEGEIASCVELTKLMLTTLGLTDIVVRVSLRDPKSDKYVGSPENWAKAEENLRRVVKKLDMNAVEAVGEAAFYGPKIDFIVRDCIGRERQLGTVQVDYNLPERFGLEYIGADNTAHRPVMVHRAPLGAFERFVGILIEHYAGAFPLWLAPEQVRVLPIGEAQADYGGNVLARLRAAGFRAEINSANEKIGAKIRQATLDKVPYMAVVGAKEAAQNMVSVRDRKTGSQSVISFEQFVKLLEDERNQKK
jgi:threonyl-tRNA synthetase